MVVLFYIITNTQVAIGNAQLYHESLPTSIDGCINVVDSIQNISITRLHTVDDTFALYKISFMVIAHQINSKLTPRINAVFSISGMDRWGLSWLGYQEQ